LDHFGRMSAFEFPSFSNADTVSVRGDEEFDIDTNTKYQDLLSLLFWRDELECGLMTDHVIFMPRLHK